jgi:hypothetical protein
MLRFKSVEIDSKVFFNGRKKKPLPYPVRSVALVPVPASASVHKSRYTMPEIFWQ